jgi:hypothetical protein
MCDEGIYIKGLHVHLYKLIKDDYPLIYLCHVCSSVLFSMMGEGDGIYLQLLHASFLRSGTGKRI